MNVRDLDLETAKAFFATIREICDYAEKRMSQFTREGLDEKDDEYRDDIEYELFVPAYLSISDLYGELQSHIRFLRRR